MMPESYPAPNPNPESTEVDFVPLVGAVSNRRANRWIEQESRRRECKKSEGVCRANQFAPNEEHEVHLRGLENGMRDTYTRLFVHCIWGTWNREPIITPTVEAAIYADIRIECEKLKCELLEIGGTE